MPLRLIHLTDLHIADQPDWNPDAFVGRARNPLDPGHDPDAAKKLSLLFQRNGWTHDPTARVLVTGDLTRTGGSSQFGCAHRLLHAEWAESAWVRYSLRVEGAGTPTATVPGNHDYWGGYDLLEKVGKATVGMVMQAGLGLGGTAMAGLIPRMMTSVRGAHFRQTPWLEVIPIDAGSNRRLELIGLDSCSGLGGVGGVSPTWMKSFGRVSDRELEQASRVLPPETDEPAHRVLMIHHPPATLDMSSRPRFFRWLEQEQIKVILTGHTHEADCYRLQLPSGYEVVVFDAGSTLQYRSASHVGAPAKGSAKRYDTFMEHRVSVDPGGDLSWECREWVYHRSLRSWQHHRLFTPVP